MRVPIFQFDGFAAPRFSGNPAAVIPLQSFLEDSVLQAIALENNLAETAFLVRQACRAIEAPGTLREGRVREAGILELMLAEIAQARLRRKIALHEIGHRA
jgi:hypothetical protein